MSFWKSLFGGSGGGDKPAGPPKTVQKLDHNGFTIEAQPYPEAGQFQVAGLISKQVGGELKTYRFVRADRYSTLEDAATFAITKGRQIVDLEGERIFK